MKGEERCCIAPSEREGAGGRLSIIFARPRARQDPFSIDQLFDIKRRQKGALSKVQDRQVGLAEQVVTEN